MGLLCVEDSGLIWLLENSNLVGSQTLKNTARSIGTPLNTEILP